MRLLGAARYLLPVVMLGASTYVYAETAARTHALLVGVSEYPYLGKDVQLIGPRNDVDLWMNFLQERGIAKGRTQVLADGIDGAGMPTRAAILASLDRLADEAAAGDFVFMLFAGHGAQQPASPETLPDEPDGLDEIFLPRDARGWNAPRAAVENAIIDAEFKVAIDAIREKGAFVWAIFDTCHSATMTRAAGRPEGVRYRQVSPSQLGIPAEALAQARAAAGGQARTRGQAQVEVRQAPLGRISEGLDGGLVAFYAAQSTQEAPEFAQPRGSAEARDHGVFSFTLYQVVSGAPAASYRQVMDSVIQRFHTIPGATAVPMAEGTDLDSGVFGGAAGAVRQWRVNNDGRRLRLAAGQIQDLSEGAILSLHPDATASDEQVISYVEITSVDLLSAMVRPIVHNEKGAPPLRTIPPVTFARPVQVPVDFMLSIGLLDGSDEATSCERPGDTTRAAVGSLRGSDHPVAPRLTWTDAGGGLADIWLCEHDGRLYIVDDHTPLADDDRRPLSPSFGIEAHGAEALSSVLGDALNHVVRVRNLLRVSQQSGVSGAPPVLRSELYLRRTVDTDPPCDALGAPVPIDGSVLQPAGVELSLLDGDCVSLFVTNTAATAVDITILYVDANYGITALWPTARQLHNARVEAGGRIAIGEFEAQADSMGREQLIILGVPVEAASQPVDLRFLAQASIPTRTRGQASSGSVQDLLMDAGFGSGRTRSMRSPGRGGVRLEAVVFPTRVMPRH